MREAAKNIHLLAVVVTEVLAVAVGSLTFAAVSLFPDAT